MAVTIQEDFSPERSDQTSGKTVPWGSHDALITGDGQGSSIDTTDLINNANAVPQLQSDLSKNTIVKRTGILISSGWIGSSSPWTQTLNIDNKEESVVGLSSTSTDAQYNAARSAGIRASGRTDTTITFTAMDELPTVDIPIEYVGIQ